MAALYQGSGDYTDVFLSGNTSGISNDWNIQSIFINGTDTPSPNRDKLYQAMNGKSVVVSTYTGSVPLGTASIGDYGDGTIYNLSGHMYGYVVRAGTLTVDERSDIQTYMANRIGVTL